MLIAQILLILFPFVIPFVVILVSDMSLVEGVKFISPVWLFISPFWAITISVIAFWRGRTIEVIETAKLALVTAKDVSPHGLRAFHFIKKKVIK